jgi:UDP-glucuronate 4-epimerase
MAIHKFTQLIGEGKPIQIFGDGSSGRDYTYIDDIIKGVISALEKPRSFEIFNLGDSRVIKLMDLVMLIEKALGRKAIIKKVAFQAGDMPITWANIDKAKELLGYSPCIGIEEGIERFVSWYLKNRKRGKIPSKRIQ